MPTVIASCVGCGAEIPYQLSSRAALVAARRSHANCHREPRWLRRGDPLPTVIASRVGCGVAIPYHLDWRVPHHQYSELWRFQHTRVA